MAPPLVPGNDIPVGMVPVDCVLGTNVATVSPPGNLRVELPASQLFWDAFNTATLDTVIRWTATSGGTGATPTSVQGDTVLSGGTTANSFSRLQSQPAFTATQPGFLICRQNNNIEFPVLLNSYRFWGLGNLPATPTIAAPVTDGVGFEIGTNGHLAAVTWAAGVRTLIQDLSPKALGGSGAQPQDANSHKYWVYFTGDVTYYAIDNPDNVVANFLTGAPGPANNNMSTCAVVISNAGTAATITINGVTVADSAHTGVSIVDGTYGFRKANVNSGSHNVANVSNYTVISTAGTTAVASGGGIYYGVNVISIGTTWAVTPYDVVVAGTTTNTLAATATATAAGLLGTPGASGVGVRFVGQLALVTSGTPGQFNALWD